ncbi:K02A2.6-like [Cordylochernes scorpioides]|uniref:RNA-directed DNA polymerase n=1 Tax=Cordylochernes scorpioides TaxID=51811 RepID=A0ABY6L1B2_9ARAC|nr:K02A2.6-like [Cordylochernes scorpioides]
MEADAFAADSNMSTDTAPPYPWSGTLAEVYQLGQLKSGFLKRSTPLLTMLLLVRDCLFVRVILLVSQLAFISEGRSPIRHLGTRPIAVSSAKGQEKRFRALKIKLDVLQASRLCKKAWDQVTSETIKHCFKKAGFVKKEEDEENADDIIAETMPSVDGWEDVISNPTISYDDFLNVDDDVAVCGEITDADIIAEVLNHNIEKQDGDEASGDEDESSAMIIMAGTSRQLLLLTKESSPDHFLECKGPQDRTCIATLPTLICMDPRELNKYVQRERYILPTAETIFSELKGATVFSVFDASSAFWQIPLDKESTNLCTIATPFGRFRFKRLPYGLNSASEVFQRCINNILSGLQGTACYMDDILIYGSTMEEHNRNLETVLRRLEENNVKLNAKKQQIAVEKVNFLGHIISRDGIAIQASRAEAIQKLKRPENKTEVQRFLGMVTYLGKFIPNLSDKTAPLRKLISNKSEWKFGGEEIDCFEKLKDMVSNAPILTFFDPTKPITISSDASQYGIGTVLMQGGHAIEYASFSLNATQRKYAQIEKELLAIVFGCERFQYYIWGNDVIVETDHKPLLSIVKKPLEKLSPRLQRMVLRLMRFQISLKFTPGKNMFVADHLSRDPLKDEVDTSYLEGQTESVHMLLVTTDEKIKRLQKETHGDHTLIQLIEYAKNGWPKYKTMVCDEAKPYWQFQDEIHVSDGIVYKGNCIMVPSTLRKEILQVVHSSHQGIAASKEKARSAFYWPGMITQVENEVEKCRTCQEYSRKNPEESRIAHEIPEFPWEKIAVDFMEVSGTSSILVVDYHSKFVEIRKLSSKRETETILQLKTIFRTHGIPRTLVSDNGPPFNSTGFKNFAQKYEFKHQTSSPKYPRSNGQVERTIQTIKGLIIKAMKSGRDPNLALMEFNNTPKWHNNLQNMQQLSWCGTNTYPHILMPSNDCSLAEN